MFKKRLFVIMSAVVLLVTVAFTLRTSAAPAPSVLNPAVASDYFERHPEMVS